MTAEAATIAVDANSIAGPRFASLPPLALYVHIPWCLRKCPYCDFNSHEWRAARGASATLPPQDAEAAYVSALITDVEAALPSVWGRKVGSVFIGGGTPSLFSAGAIERLLSALRARLPLLPDAEITLEANPGTFERDKFAGFFAAGVNRLSLGVQSFDDRALRALGRVHDAGEARRAIESALMIFGNVNLDLMFALPGQSVDEARRDAAEALSFGVPHLSFYHLTIEPNTLFHRDPPSLPDDETAADIEDAVVAMLARAGYEHYETSAHAKPGFACRHNVNYWRFGDYLGVGAGAHSKLSFPDRVVRQVRYRQPKQYLEQLAGGTPIQEETRVGARDLPFEFMLNALRLADGVPAALFAERTGLPLAVVARPIAEAVRRGLLDPDPQRLRATPLGRRFLNDLQSLFLP
ncbi:MAG TPA: radical SAM family heme chaperone HemW [Casimicrobiaceae bacterium]|nr:radical SAM family heme chaperone HemW [Casimicrobiaceae bacterium]